MTPNYRLIISLLIGFAVHQLPAQTARSIQQSESMRFTAMQQQDTQLLVSLLHNDLLYVHSNGLNETKSDFITSVASGRIKYTKITQEQVTVVQKGRMGYANGIIQVTGSIKETPFDVRLRYLSVYQRTKSRWQLVRWQSLKL